MTVEQAKQRLLRLIQENGGMVTAATIEALPELAGNHEVVSAAARMLATDPEIVTGIEAHGAQWFPYEYLKRADEAALSSGR